MSSDPAAPFGVKARTGTPRKSPSQGGRPTLMQPELIAQFIQAIRIGCTRERACDVVGVAYDSFWRWAKKGARDRRKGVDSKYARFSEAVQKAMGEAYQNHMATIAQAAGGRDAKYDGKGRMVMPALVPDWKASMTWMERLYPKEHARRTYRIDEDRVPQGAVGAVVPYEVRIPAVDPLPAAPPRPDTAREEPSAAGDVKRKQHDPDADV